MRKKYKTRPLIVSLTLCLTLSVSSPVAAEDDLEQAEVDHAHTSDEELYMLDAASSAAGATFFNESSGCGDSNGAMTPATTTNSTSSRSIPSGHQVRGPWGDFFGRDYGDVSSSMVSWTVPMSGGRVVKVHERAYPAYQLVTQNLAARQAEGKYYNVRIAASFVWRRIGGSYRMSTHAFGTTIDINWDRNPFRRDNVLVTDMPDWFVDAWRDAGFCWGGDWLYIKDTMHFAWMGPNATPNYGSLGKPYAPNTAKAAYTEEALSRWSGFPSAAGGEFVIADGNGDGAPDLVRLRDYGANGIQLSYARSSKNFRRCGVSSYTAYGAQGADDYIVADYDGDSRPDLWALDTGGSRVRIEAFTYRSGYRDKTAVTTGARPRSGATYMVGDYNRDGKADLYVVTPGANTRVEVWSGSNSFGSRLVDGTASLDSRSWQFSIGDDDVDGRDDVVAIDDTGAVRLRTLLAKGGFSQAPVGSSTGATASSGDRFALGDLDGDGRPDLWQIDAGGHVSVRRGGNSTLPVAYWYQRPGWSCDGLSPADPWDFDGNSFHDMALGSPGEDIDTIGNAGAVNVIYGSNAGPTVDNDDLLHQDQSAITGLAEQGDRFGRGMASGDFDNDGYADLAIAAPLDDVGLIKNGGLINVVMGTDTGLGAAGGQLWHRDITGVRGTVGVNDRFGTALVSGDFNSDGFYDLAVGVPGDEIGGASGAGSVSVLYGAKLGLKTADDQIWSQNSASIRGVAGTGDEFGAALAVGDFNHDGYDDLIVGAPGDVVGSASGAGQIHVIYGSRTGLTAEGNNRFHQDTVGVADIAARNDGFGSTVAAGDFDGDGYSDVAVGVPNEDDGAKKSIGKVHVIFGGGGGLAATDSELWSQSSAGVGSGAQRNDRFGAALAAGDFDDDGFDDLAVGVPGEDYDGARNTGAINVLYGRTGGLKARNGNFIGQGHKGLVGTAEAGDRFGSDLRAIDVNGNNRWDLLVGLPGEDLGVANAGAMILIMGSGSGLKTASSSVWHQDTSGIQGTVEAGDGFGNMR
ncbi:MAG: hypothetical protein GY720_13100 [bacterium]|nr:hypothetical protein [bacterium]